jgi:hypothetical protein
MKRITAVLAAVALALFTMAIVANDARADTVTEPVGTAGTVTFSTDGGVLAFVAASAADGWDYTVVRQDDTHLKVVFLSGDGREAEFEAEIEGGQLVTGSDGDSTSSTAGDVTVTTQGGDDSDGQFDDHGDDSQFDEDSPGSTVPDDQFNDDSDDQFDDHGDDANRSSDDDSDHSSTGSDDSDDSGGDDGTTTTTTAATEPTLVTTPVVDAGTVTVLFVDGEVVFSAATVSDGWSYEVDHSGGSHVSVELRSQGTEIEFRIDADGRIRIEQDA